MTTLFADTVYYLALLSPRDEAHERAASFTATFDGAIVTTDWVLTELADGLASVPMRGGVVRFLDSLRLDPAVTIVAAHRSLFEKGYDLYAARPDKDWPLTDCISLVVMRETGITDALTGDHHFEQAGYRALLS